MFPAEIVLHLETTKQMLMTKLFTNNIMCFHTLPDYYLDSSTANNAVSFHLNKILAAVSNSQYGHDEAI
jgi:hypothetical protein